MNWAAGFLRYATTGFAFMFTCCSITCLWICCECWLLIRNRYAIIRIFRITFPVISDKNALFNIFIFVEGKKLVVSGTTMFNFLFLETKDVFFQ